MKGTLMKSRIKAFFTEPTHLGHIFGRPVPFTRWNVLTTRVTRGFILFGMVTGIVVLAMVGLGVIV